MQMFTVPDGVRAIIPAFQLDNAGEPRGDLAPLLAVLLPAGVDGWELWTWLTSPTSLLSGDIPDPTRRGARWSTRRDSLALGPQP